MEPVAERIVLKCLREKKLIMDELVSKTWRLNDNNKRGHTVITCIRSRFSDSSNIYTGCIVLTLFLYRKINTLVLSVLETP